MENGLKETVNKCPKCLGGMVLHMMVGSERHVQ